MGLRVVHFLERSFDVYVPPRRLFNVIQSADAVLCETDLMSNLILGAVVENFSYVFQVYGKVKMINREQMRSFKKAWAQFDPERSGYIKKADIVPFLGVSHLILTL